MISLLLLKQIVILFLIMLLGFILVKSNLLKPEESKSLSIVALYIVTPCVIINAFQIEYTEDIKNGLILAFGAAIFIHIILFIMLTIFKKIFKLDSIEKASIMYSNSGNLIIPIVTSVLGSEYVIYSSAFISVQLIFIWTHCRMIICEEKKLDIKKIFLNVNMISIFIGIILFVFRIKIPGILTQTMSSISVMIGPLAMIVTGMLIGSVSFKEVFSYNRIYLVVFLKMILSPIIILIMLKYASSMNLIDDSNTILLISLLATITPSASTVTQMAQIYDKNSKYASIINVTTTIICIITMPIMVYIYML